MNLPDTINGAFELFGGFAIFGHVKRIRIDKMTKGLDPKSTVFFTSWGLWNLFYYPHLGQWMSTIGGAVLVVGNAVWVYHMWMYRKARRETTHL